MRFAKIIAPLCGLGIIGFVIWLMRPIEETDERDLRDSARFHAEFQVGIIELKNAEKEGEQRLILDRLATFLRLQDKALVLKWIEEFFRSGLDAKLTMRFEPGSGGTMKSWPSLRVFLLDWLLSYDPEMAAEISREVLEGAGSADEWAISLRNLGVLGDPADLRLMEQKTGELIGNEEWLRNPTAGFLEAFDLVVFLGKEDLIPEVADLLNGSQSGAVEFASNLTLNRMVEAYPAETLDHLLSDPASMSAYPEAKAEIFARAEVRTGEGAERVRAYLLSENTSAQELEHFFQTFPHRGRFISNNLLTKSASPPGYEFTIREAAVLARIKQWQVDPEFRQLRPYLFEVEQRLSSQ